MSRDVREKLVGQQLRSALMKIAALEYEAALERVCRDAVDRRLGPPGSYLTWYPGALEELAKLRDAAVREYAADLRADEEQRIAEAVKGW